MRLGPVNLIAAAYVCRHLRAGDRREAFATRHGDDTDALAMEIVQTWGAYGWACYGDDGTPVALIGATERWPGVWACWMIATDRFKEVGKGLTKFATRNIIPGLIELGATRIEAYSIDGHDEAHRWLRFLGAVEEARLRRYGRSGEDFRVFRLDTNVLG